MSRTKSRIVDTDSMGARCVEIKNKHVLAFTPTRVVTSTEMRYVPDIVKAGYLEPEFPSQIAELILDFRDRESRTSILRSNESFASKIRNIHSLVTKAEGKLTIFRPAVNLNDTISADFMEATIQAGVESGCNMISVLDENNLMSATDQEKWLLRAERFASGFSATLGRDVELMPSIRMNVDDIPTLLARIQVIKDMGYENLNIILAPYSKFSRNYFEFRRRYHRNNFWIHASETKRVWGQDDKKTSWMHTLQFFGMDTFALQLPNHWAPMPPRTSVHDKPITEVRLFDDHTIGITGLSELMGRYGDRIKPTSPIFRGRKFEEFAPAMRRKKILDQACKIDENISSTKQFAKGREYIKKQESMNYVHSKEYLNMAVREVLGNQRMLNI